MTIICLSFFSLIVLYGAENFHACRLPSLAARLPLSPPVIHYPQTIKTCSECVGLFLLNDLLRLCVWSARRSAVVSCLPLRTCVIKRCTERPIEWATTLLMFSTRNQTLRLVGSAMVHYQCNYPAGYTSQHLHRYKVHLPTCLRVNLTSVCISKAAVVHCRQNRAAKFTLLIVFCV